MYLASYSKEYVPRHLWVKAESARETYQTAIGAHHDQREYFCIGRIFLLTLQLSS